MKIKNVKKGDIIQAKRHITYGNDTVVKAGWYYAVLEVDKDGDSVLISIPDSDEWFEGFWVDVCYIRKAYRHETD